MYKRPRKNILDAIYSFTIAWIVLNLFFPVYKLLGFVAILGFSCLVAYFFGKGLSSMKASRNEAAQQKESQSAKPAPNTTSARVGSKQETATSTSTKVKKSYGPEVDPIIEEGNRALSEMGRLYMSIKDVNIRTKINEIMKITDKIMQDAIEDPSDIPQIKKFFRYYLPTTIKLLNSYDRMSSQDIEGENIGKSMKSIDEMLDVAIDAYKKRLDSLFENQALDIETDIDVMNQMLAREGLTDNKDFNVPQTGTATAASSGAAFGSAAAQAQQVQKGN